MSFVRKNVERLSNRSETTENIRPELVRAAGQVSVREEVEIVREPSLNDLDAMFNSLAPETQVDQAVITLYEAAAAGNLPVADVMQYMYAYDMAVHFEYGGYRQTS